MSTTPRIQFPLLPVTASDKKAIADLTVSACLTDLLSVPFQWTTPQNQHRVVRGFASQILDNPTWEVLKAVHPTTGEIVGWGAAKLHPADWDTSSSLPMQEEKEAEKEKEASGKDDGEETAFAKFLSKEEKRLQKLWLSGRRWLYLCALFTAPEWQGKGIGTAIIERLCERADREGVPGFLQGTRGATGFYESKGWKCVERFDVDLGKWIEGEGHGYGVYWLSYCLRLPKEKETWGEKKLDE